MNIVFLPDEIKLKIFQYLNGVDKIEILRVCEDFRRVGVDRKILQYLDFSYNYKFSIKSHLKCAQYKMVTHLNLNGIYWIPSAELRNAVIKFTNLNSLHVVDTQLSYRDLVTVLQKTEQVRRLSFSLRPDNCGDVYMLQIETPITHLYVTFFSHQIRCLIRLLGHFTVLQQLWLIEPLHPHSNLETFTQLSQLQLPQITQRVVISQRRDAIMSLKKLFENRNLETLTYHEDKYNFFTVLGVAGQLNPLHDYATIEDIKTKNNIKLSGLYCWCNETNVKLLTELPVISSIKKWVGTSQNFWQTNQIEQTPTNLFKKRRIGVSSQVHGDDTATGFARFARHTPHIEHFEIVDEDRESLRKFPIESLKFIAHWTHLKHLTITSLNLKSGKFMSDVLRTCRHLTRLKIHDMSFQDDFSSDLCSALVYAENLRDFRFERNGSLSIDRLYEALVFCTKLERVYVQYRFAPLISKLPIENLLRGCQNLVYFFLYISEIPETGCRTIRQSIRECKPQQVLLIKGQTYDLKTIIYNDVPMVHIEDMVCQTNHFYSDFIKNAFYYG